MSKHMVTAITLPEGATGPDVVVLADAEKILRAAGWQPPTERSES